jgi:hypothetical protein
MPSTNADRPVPPDDEGGSMAGTFLVGGLALLFVVAVVALVYLAV